MAGKKTFEREGYFFTLQTGVGGYLELTITNAKGSAPLETKYFYRTSVDKWRLRGAVRGLLKGQRNQKRWEGSTEQRKKESEKFIDDLEL